MLACIYQQLRGPRSQKLVAAASIFCHPIGLPSFIALSRLHTAAPSRARFDPTRRIVVGSGVGAGALESPGSPTRNGPPEPPALPPPANGPRLLPAPPE